MGKAYNPPVPKVYSIDGITPVVHPSAFVKAEARIPARARRRHPGAIPLSELKKRHA